MSKKDKKIKRLEHRLSVVEDRLDKAFRLIIRHDMRLNCIGEGHDKKWGR